MTTVVMTGCSSELPPTGQVRLYVDTDAQVPRVDDTGAVVGGLFDSLVVEVYRPNEEAPCAGCSRTFAIDEEALAAREVSLGLPVEPGVEGYRVRLRLYHSEATIGGGPPDVTAEGTTTPSVIERWVTPPAVSEEGIVEAHVVLETERVGFIDGSPEAPLEMAAGPPLFSRVGTWSSAAPTPCAGEPGPGEVCVPGGAYWMGNPHALGFGIGDAWSARRLVALRPFYMDAVEVTVEAWRAYAPDGGGVVPWNGTVDGEQFEDYCTFTPAPGPRDGRPIVCLTRDMARGYCLAQGKELPTEAQLEYVASGLEGRLFVWGQDEPACEDAVISRYGFGLFDNIIGLGCQAEEAPGGVELVGAFVDPPRRDRLELAGGTLYDLVGNATEWALDRWNRQSEPCWSGGGVYRDPLCGEPSPADGDFPVFRLGSFVVGGRQATATYRSFIGDNAVLGGNGVDLGFRCVRPAE